MPVKPAKRTAFALVAASAALSVALTATPALADPASPLGIGVARTVDSQRGTFTVPVWTDASGAAVTSVQAVIRDTDGSAVGDPLTLQQSGDVWAVASDAPLKLTEDGGSVPHLGRYAIDVTATDDQGDTVTRSGAGTLDFTLRPDFTGAGEGTGPWGQNTLVLSPSTLDKDHRATGADDHLVGIQPGSGDLVPIAGRTVAVTRSSQSDVNSYLLGPDAASATTGADGRFTTGPLQADGSVALTAEFSENSDEVHGSATLTGYPTYSQTTGYLTAGANLKRAAPGQKVTISGYVRSGTSATSPGIAGAHVTVSPNGYAPSGQPGEVTVTTDAAGHFSGAVTAAPDAMSGWSAALADRFVTGDKANGSVVVPEYSSFVNLKSTLAATGKVTVKGRIVATYARNSAIYHGQVVHLEYSKDGSTGWKDLGTTTQGADSSSFSITKWGYVDGYYRVHHFISDELAASYSTPVRLNRTNTNVYSISATPAKVSKGATVTVKGTLKEYKNGSWKAYAGQKVYLYFQKKGSTSWTYITSGKTGSNGAAKLKGKATKDGYWLIQYFGDAKHFDSDGVKDYVDVR